MRASLILLLVATTACGARGDGGDGDTHGHSDRGDGSGGSPGTARIPGWPVLVPRDPETPPCPPCGEPDPVWQPGFHQALRWEHEVADRTTFRMKVPIGRSGEQLRVAFRAGDGSAKLHGATVAHAAGGGHVASRPVRLTFDGDEGVRFRDRERIVSDPIDFPVQQGDELYVSFEMEGHLAAGAIDLFPDSFAAHDADPDDPVVDGWHERRAIGLASLLVLGPPGRAVVALGDSITEAFVDGRDDYRRNWPHLAEMATGIPIANAAVSGQGMWAALRHVDDEVLVLPGITDCVVLLGTNDLGAVDEHKLTGDLEELFGDLEDSCRIWAGTLPPKERPDVGEEILHVWREVNRWIREEAEVEGVIDFAAILAHPDDPERWAPGLDEDGIHPSVAGQAVMADEVARVLSTAGD